MVCRARCKDCDEAKESDEKNAQKDNANMNEETSSQIYIGETGRCLAERSREHINGLKKGDKENFIVKHWAIFHPEKEEPPLIKFEVVKNHRQHDETST